LKRLDFCPPAASSSIGWYARFPNHHAGEASGATAARGEAPMKMRIDSIANAIRHQVRSGGSAAAAEVFSSS
jgi:hypothetical protein